MEKLPKGSSRIERGIVLGSFCPVHEGHVALWEFAGAHAREVIITLCARPSDEIPGIVRLNWIKEITQRLPYVFVVDYLFDELEILPWEKEGSSREVSKVWAQAFLERYSNYLPTVIFTSEDYGDFMAEYMGIKHIVFDKGRRAFPVSGRKIRANPNQYKEFIPSEVKKYFD